MFGLNCQKHPLVLSPHHQIFLRGTSSMTLEPNRESEMLCGFDPLCVPAAGLHKTGLIWRFKKNKTIENYSFCTQRT